MSLTDKQKKFFEYIQAFIENYEEPPSFEQLQMHFGFASKSSVYKNLQILKNKGLIDLSKSNPVTISLLKAPHKALETYTLPLIGALNDEGLIDIIEEDQTILCSSSKKLSKNCYALKIKSGNYLEAGLLHQDLVIIEPRSEARAGETILGYIYQERHVIKKYQPQGPYTRLDSFCVQLEPMIIAMEELSIQGILLGVIRTY